MDPNVFREFWKKVVPHLPKPDAPKQEGADDVSEAEKQAEAAAEAERKAEAQAAALEAKAEAAEEKAESAAYKAEIMARLAALVGPYKKAIADNGTMAGT